VVTNHAFQLIDQAEKNFHPLKGIKDHDLPELKILWLCRSCRVKLELVTSHLRALVDLFIGIPLLPRAEECFCTFPLEKSARFGGCFADSGRLRNEAKGSLSPPLHRSGHPLVSAIAGLEKSPFRMGTQG